MEERKTLLSGQDVAAEKKIQMEIQEIISLLNVFIKVNVKVSLARNKRDESLFSSHIPQMLSFTFLGMHKSDTGFRLLYGKQYQTLK